MTRWRDLLHCSASVEVCGSTMVHPAIERCHVIFRELSLCIKYAQWDYSQRGWPAARAERASIMFYTFNKHQGPDFAGGGFSLDAFTAHETAASAAWEILGYDRRDFGVVEIDEAFTPFSRRMDGQIELWTNLAGLSEEEAIQNVLTAGQFDVECVNAEQALQIIKDVTAE